MNSDVSHARLLELLRYSPEDGTFVWKKHRQSCYVGKETFETNSLGYKSIRIDGVRYKAHRLAWLYVHGRWPHGSIDHINGDAGDNRLANLRECSHAQNHQNRGLERGNTSGYTGVSWHKAKNSWRAVICVNGKSRHIGSFQSKEDAYSAYCEAKKSTHQFQPTPRT